MPSKGIFLSLGEELEVEEWIERIMKFLEKRGKASFQEIVKEMKLEGAAIEVLSSLLGTMLSEGMLNSEPKSIAVMEGLVLTRVYELPEEVQPKSPSE